MSSGAQGVAASSAAVAGVAVIVSVNALPAPTPGSSVAASRTNA